MITYRSRAELASSRYSQHKLNTDERPTHLYSYTVTGRGSFPFDMLRHDGAWPADGHADINGTDRRSVELLSYRAPNVERWRSFLWTVTAQPI
jgi:hypothetical protein